MSTLTYLTTADEITEDQLDGEFFEGWLDPPSPTTLLRILQSSSHVVVAVRDGKVVAFVTAISDGVLSAFITLLEVAIFYIPALGAVLVPLLLGLSAGKFLLVVMFFMHLRFDSRLFTRVFVAGLLLSVPVLVVHGASVRIKHPCEQRMSVDVPKGRVAKEFEQVDPYHQQGNE